MKMNKYLRYWSIILLFIGLLFFCDNGQLVHAQDNNSVISNDEINDDFTKLGQEYNKCVITDTCGRQVIVERKTKENYIQEITVKVLGSDGSEIEGTTQKYNIRSTMNTANMDTYAQILDSYTNQEGL